MKKIKLKTAVIYSDHHLSVLRMRILTLHQMMQGIPEKRVDLGTFNSENMTKITCGTHACILGWAAFYPPAREWGLGQSTSGTPTLTDGIVVPEYAEPRGAADSIFWKGSYNYLFASRSLGEWDADLRDRHGYMTDKELALARLSYAYNTYLIG